MEIKSRNTNTLSGEVYRAINQYGFDQTSRNGPVRRILEPVSICLTNPRERVNFSALRDANPFFHLMEAMAMLAPVNSVKLMSHFAKNMASFSDDKVRYNAFYGERARQWESVARPGFLDQFDLVIKELSEKPDSRQCVVQLWDPIDLIRVTKDKACNLCMLFDVSPSRWPRPQDPATPTANMALRMTSFNRSNDAVLGSVTGANVVHLSFFHEYVALALGLPMGDWWHVSNNLHAYLDNEKWKKLCQFDDSSNPYDQWPAYVPLYENRRIFDEEIKHLVMVADSRFDLLEPLGGSAYQTPFIRRTVVPVYNAWQAHKRGDTATALSNCGLIASDDWRMACELWMKRRLHKKS